jgi:hypothetical protein
VDEDLGHLLRSGVADDERGQREIVEHALQEGQIKGACRAPLCHLSRGRRPAHAMIALPR